MLLKVVHGVVHLAWTTGNVPGRFHCSRSYPLGVCLDLEVHCLDTVKGANAKQFALEFLATTLPLLSTASSFDEQH